MKLFKRRVESVDFKRVLTRFYQRKVKPALLSTKHFFKSSHKYFKNHPRLRTVSIVGGVFLSIIIVSAVVNTFSRMSLNSNADAAYYDKVVDEFWHQMSSNGKYSRPIVTLSYVGEGEECVGENCGMAGTGVDKDHAFEIGNVTQFMYVRSLGRTATEGKYYKIVNNLDFTNTVLLPINTNNTDALFAGVLDGNFKHIKGVAVSVANTSSNLNINGLIPGITGTVDHPAVLTNFIFENTTLNVSGNFDSHVNAVGILTGYVGNYSFVLNSGNISGSTSIAGCSAVASTSSNNNGLYIGGLVGYLANSTALGSGYSLTSTFSNGVANTYNYVNFSISGGGASNVRVGGVIGYRANNNDDHKMDGNNSFIIASNYYGRMTVSGNTDYRFVYNGYTTGDANVSTSYSPTLTYYWYKGDNRDVPSNYTTPTWSIAKDAEYLESEGFVANLNSNKKVLAYYFNKALGSGANSNLLFDYAYTNAEWYLDPSDFGNTSVYFPILRNRKMTRDQSSNVTGSIEVNLDGVSYGGAHSLNLEVTNQDEKINDFVYRKVTLPFAKDVFNATSYVSNGYTMTFNGWRLKEVYVRGKSAPYTTAGSIAGMDYNYTLRNQESAYTKNINEVYAEGGYYLIPDNVYKVKFEAVWAYTVFVSDNSVEKAFNGKGYTAESRDYASVTTGNGRTANTPVSSMADAYTTLAGYQNSASRDEYTNVIVLVGNCHTVISGLNNGSYSTRASWVGSLSTTIKSIDENDDKKPDYSLYIAAPTLMTIGGSLRLDFVNVIGIPQVGGYAGSPQGFILTDEKNFITTETVTTDYINLYLEKAEIVKVLGGYFNIFGSYDRILNDESKRQYMIFGGTARANNIVGTTYRPPYDCGNGNCTVNDSFRKTQENGRIINIVGGRANFVSYDKDVSQKWWGDVRNYIDGGYINEFYAVYMSEVKGKLYNTINNAFINNCYGGGFSDTAFILSGVDFTIDNSRIGYLFGGPKFGKLDGNVLLTVTNSVLDYVYGGGYGGTEYFTSSSSSYISTSRTSNNGKFKDGVGSRGNGRYLVHMNFIKGSDGNGTNRGFKVVDYRLKTVGINGTTYYYTEDVLGYLSNSEILGVTFNISDSKVNKDIYGGGNRGITNGAVRFNLHNVYVGGNVFGAGKSGVTDTAEIASSTTKPEYPSIVNSAFDSSTYYPGTTTHTWTQYDNIYNLGFTSTTIDSINANAITGVVQEASDIYINMSGDQNGKYRMYVEESVYGGGDEADVTLRKNGRLGDIHVNINDGVHINKNVFGGGNMKKVSANTHVIVNNPDANNPTIIGGSVYAGGNQANVEGSATVTISGNPQVNNVFGGGNKGPRTETIPETNVYIEGGDVQNVFGGSDERGIVGTSNIYIGKKSPEEMDTGFVTLYDFCGNRAFNVRIINNNNNSPAAIMIQNLTNQTFKNYSFTIKLSSWTVSNQINGASFNSSWQNDSATNFVSYSGGIITVRDYNKWGASAGDQYTMAPGQEIGASAYWGKQVNIQIESISFVGDSGTEHFTSDNCPISYYSNNSYQWWNPKQVSNTTEKRTTKLSDIMVHNIYGSNNKGGRTIDTNILVLSGNYYQEENYHPEYYNSPYTVTVGNVYGGGNETQTGPDVEGRDGTAVSIDTYNNNSNNYVGFDHNGWKFVPEHKARIIIYGAHVTGSVYGGGKGNDELSSKAYLSTMFATPMILVTNNSTIDGNVYGGGYAVNANIGNADNYIKPVVFIDWGTIGGNVYGGGYGDVVYGGTMTYVTLFNPYNIYRHVRQWYFQMENDTMQGDHNGHKMTDDNTVTPFRGLYTIQNSPIRHNQVGSVHIKGSVFGGGERGEKEAGYDYLFDSVIDGTSVYVQEDRSICTADIDGDIFGSGNFSSSAGYSDVLILNIGTSGNPKKIKSIQRAKNVYINDSFIEIDGGTDVTNKFNKTKYAFSRVEGLYLGGSSELYLKAQGNLLESVWFYEGWTSMLDNGWTYKNRNSFYEGLSTVSFPTTGTRYVTDDGERKRVVNGYSGNTMNRIYLMNDKGLNILTEEEVAQGFGRVHGMGYFGLFTEGANGKPDLSYFTRGLDNRNDSNNTVYGYSKTTMNAYILGANYNVSQNYEKDGFITTTYLGNPGNGKVYTTIVNPTPQNQRYFYWTIGNPVIATEINLTASKYIRSGMKALTLYNFDPETYNHVIFDIADVSVDGLKTEANYINPQAVPTLSESDDDAVKTFGLSIETSDAGWINEGLTYFESDYNGGSRTADIKGTTKYETSGSSNIPQLIFNLENSRNIKNDIDLGYMLITINAHAYSRSDPLNAVNTTFKVRVNMDTYYYEDNEYESSMAPGKHYKSFLSAPTNITSNSEFSTYYNMYAYGIDLYDYLKTHFYKEDEVVNFDHVLYSTYMLPAGTRITMLDISTNEPKYYYYDVTGSEVLATEEHKKVSGERTIAYVYPVSWFKAMDVTSDGDKYDEAINQARYVINEGEAISTIEQFIFMVDFKNVTQHTKQIDQITNEEFFLGLRATTGEGVSKKQAYPMYETMKDMHYNVFDQANVSFGLTLYDTPTEDDTVYVDDTFTFDVDVAVSDPVQPRNGQDYLVRNTNYYQDRLGLRIGLYHITEDDEGNERATLVSGDELAGAVFYIDGLGYAPSANGFIRLKMADFVVSIEKEIKVDLTNAENLTSGMYEFRVTAFASGDGMYAKQGDDVTNSMDSFRVYLVNEHYGLLATIDDDKDVIVYSDGKTAAGNDTIETTINYFGSYQNPNIKISLKRRDYSTVENRIYNDVNINDYFDISSTTFSDTSQLDRTDLFNVTTMTINKDALVDHLSSGDMGVYNLTLKLKPGVDLPTGTYRIMYNLYNGDKPVGDVYTYIIIKD